MMMELHLYLRPEIQVVEMVPEGIVCGSNEPIFEETGEW